MRLTAVVIIALSLAACVEDDAAVDLDEVDAPDDDGKADVATELSVRVGETRVTVDRALARKGNNFVMHGRTSRNLDGIQAYVFDDIFGEWAQPSPRVFEISYGLTWSGPLFDGTNLFLGLGFVPSAGRADHVTARLIVLPRLGATSGSSSLAFTAELTPIVVAGQTVYRMQGRATKPLTAIAATAGGTTTTATLVDPTHYTLDLSREQVVANAGVAGTPIVVTAQAATGALVRRAALGLAVKKLGATTGDAYATWPVPTCTAVTRTCLVGLPAGALDLARCGDAGTVRACAREVGVFVDGATVAAAEAAVDARLADPAGFGADAIGLVGADHAGLLTAATRATAVAAIDREGGRWYLSAATRAAVLTGVVDRAVDAAYARPLALVPAHPPAPGDAAATRQVVADAVLGYLATQDFVHTELGRSLDELTVALRAQHVADLRGFRDGPSDVVADGPSDVYLGRWLGLYTEVAIDRATGAPGRVLVEID
ncbi:MAG: hypothetical protein IPL61_08365 [Myxococcales bacterium]|nr:hypothetical protein [Myxococcales bacterium]